MHYTQTVVVELKNCRWTDGTDGTDRTGQTGRDKAGRGFTRSWLRSKHRFHAIVACIEGVGVAGRRDVVYNSYDAVVPFRDLAF